MKLKYKKKKIKHFQGVFQSIPMLCTRNCVWVNQTYILMGSKLISRRMTFVSATEQRRRLIFLECFLYQEEREVLFTEISEYLPKFKTFSKTKKLEIILSGFNLTNPEPDPRNISVVFAVQNYILKTKRFSTPPQPTLPLSHHAPSS